MRCDPSSNVEVKPSRFNSRAAGRPAAPALTIKTSESEVMSGLLQINVPVPGQPVKVAHPVNLSASLTNNQLDGSSETFVLGSDICGSLADADNVHLAAIACNTVNHRNSRVISCPVR